MKENTLNKLKDKIKHKQTKATKQAKALDAHCWPPSDSSAIWCERARHQGVAAFASEILEIIDRYEMTTDIDGTPLFILGAHEAKNLLNILRPGIDARTIDKLKKFLNDPNVINWLKENPN